MPLNKTQTQFLALQRTTDSYELVYLSFKVPVYNNILSTKLWISWQKNDFGFN